MEFTVLGGQAAAVAPGVGCSGYLLTARQTRLVIDLGTDTLTELLRQTAIPDVTGVVISHGHLDHTLDLFGLHNTIAYRWVPYDPVPLWLPPGVYDMLSGIAHLFSGASDSDAWLRAAFIPKTYCPDEPLRIGDVTISFRQTQHSRTCYAMRLETPDGTIGYTADTGRYDDLIDFLKDVDLLVSEATYGLGEPRHAQAERPHLTLADAATLARDCGARRLLLTHTADPDSAGLRAAAEQMVSIPVAVARPGLTLSIGDAR